MLRDVIEALGELGRLVRLHPKDGVEVLLSRKSIVDGDLGFSNAPKSADGKCLQPQSAAGLTRRKEDSVHGLDGVVPPDKVWVLFVRLPEVTRK